MSQEMIAAVTSASADAHAIEMHDTRADAVDMRTLDTTEAAGGAYLQAPVEASDAPKATMNLQALAGKFSEGLQHGFYANDMDRLMNKLVESKRPGSDITSGDVTVELLNVQAKVGIADAFSKVTTKLSEGLQTMVVKQG